MVDAKPAVAHATGSNVPPNHGNSNNTFAGERSKIKLFMGRTPSIGVLKTKFLTVLGNSNELLNGISNKLTLSTSSSDSDYCDDDDEDLPKFDETIDYTKIDFEARRVKARRAHEEIISGRYRHPNLAPRPRLENMRSKLHSNKALRSSSSSSSSSSSDSSSSISLPDQNAAGVERSHLSSTTRSNSIESRHSGGYERNRAIAGARRSELDMQKDMLRTGELLSPCVETPHIDVQPPSDREYARQIWGVPQAAAGVTQPVVMAQSSGLNTSANSMRVPARSRTSNSSTLTSLRDDPDVQISPSVESTDWRNFIRSESQNSVPSWASSISLDCRAGEEPVKEFMKHFTDMLFNNTAAIDLEVKSEFGVMVRLEIGRQWFTRFLIEQKIKTKRVNELTFHSLVQFFSLVLFECGEADDFAPAAIIMNLCFLLYREIEVPGCDPYREYLFIFMRQQPIWLVLRFWNAACLDAMQMEREHRLSARLKRAEKRQQRKKAKEAAFAGDDVLPKRRPSVDADKLLRKPADSSSSSSQHSNALAVRSNAVVKSRSSLAAGSAQAPAAELTKEQEDIAFRQLGAFTCNMYSLGTPQSLCLEFLKKQVISLNLPKDKSKLIRDNVHRMYHETELWGAKDT